MANNSNSSESQGNLVQIAPGVFVDKSIRRQISQNRKVMLLDEAGYRALGLTEKQRNSLWRLCEAGMLKIYPVTPRVRLLDMQSWNEHMERLESDPWFWDDPANIQHYRGTYSKS
jgi:hypothetical protein